MPAKKETPAGMREWAGFSFAAALPLPWVIAHAFGGVGLQSEFVALEGLSQLMLTVREGGQSANPNLRIEGIVLTMYDSRNNLSQQVEADASMPSNWVSVNDG